MLRGNGPKARALLVRRGAVGPLVMRSNAVLRRPSSFPTPRWGILSMCQQELPENDGIVVRLVTRRIDKRDRIYKCQVVQSIKFLAMRLDLSGISPAELLPREGS